MKVYKIPYYDIDHQTVNQKFLGQPVFINTMTVSCMKKPFPFNVYKIIKPTKEEPKKKYLLLREIHETKEDGEKEVNLGVILADESTMEGERYQRAALCLECNHVVYSMFSGDMHTCPCMKTTVSGGKEIFIRRGPCKDIVLDLLTDQVMPEDFDSVNIKPEFFGLSQADERNQLTKAGLVVPTPNQIRELGESVQ